MQIVSHGNDKFYNAETTLQSQTRRIYKLNAKSHTNSLESRETGILYIKNVSVHIIRTRDVAGYDVNYLVGAQYEYLAVFCTLVSFLPYNYELKYIF